MPSGLGVWVAAAPLPQRAGGKLACLGSKTRSGSPLFLAHSKMGVSVSVVCQGL